MPTYTFITGELVTVEADTEEQAWELMAKGAYEFQEALTELRPECQPPSMNWINNR